MARLGHRTGALVAITALAGCLSLGWQRLDANRNVEAKRLVSSLRDLAPRELVAARMAPEPAPTPPPPATPKSWIVPRTPTPLDEVTLAQVLRRAHAIELGEAPTDLRLGVAWAHVALETARGKSIECNNLGNLSVWKDTPQPHFIRELTERRRPSYEARFGPWQLVEMRFRAFDRPLDGARAYWAHLRDHYTRALHLFTIGDGYDAGLKLARDGYATQAPEPYASSIASLTREFHARILPDVKR